MEKAKTFQELPKDYWDVVGKYLPDYQRRDDVLLSDILTRYVEGEEVIEEDLEWLPDDKEEARKQLEELDLSLYNEAVEEWERKYRAFASTLMNEGYKLKLTAKELQEWQEFAGEKEGEALSKAARELERIDDVLTDICSGRYNPYPNDGDYWRMSHDMKTQVLIRLCDVLGDSVVDLREAGIDVAAIEHHSGEGLHGRVIEICSDGFKLEYDHLQLPLRDMMLEDLCYVLDFLLNQKK